MREKPPDPPKRTPSQTTLASSVIRQHLAKHRLQVRIADLLEIIGDVRRTLPSDRAAHFTLAELEAAAKRTIEWIEESDDEE